MPLTVDALILLAIILLVIWWFLSNKDKDFYKKIPGPPALPFFGNLLDFNSARDILNVFQKYTKNYGGIVKIHMGPVHKAILVSDYKFLKFILSSMKILQKSDEYSPSKSWLGTGLLTSKGLKWKKHRRILTPAFHFKSLEQFIEIFQSSGNQLIQKLEKVDGKSSIDVYPLVRLCTLDIICESAMGTKINAQIDEDSVYVRSFQDMCRIIIERSFSLLQMFDITFPLTKNYYTQKKVLNILHQQTNNVIAKRRKELEDEIYLIKDKKVFLDLLLQATINGTPLPQEEIREEVDTFTFAGHDTTASAISFALFCLANNADVQDRVLEEQQALFGENRNDIVTYTDLKSMKYLELVIKETLRLYPPVPFYGRKTDQAVEYDGTIIPEGTTLLIFTHGIHRNPEYFDEPEKFNPSRFEDIDGKLPYTYIPFSAGPRNCIGQKFAMFELKSIISKIVRTFELRPASPKHDLQLTAETVLTSANGVRIGLKLRK